MIQGMSYLKLYYNKACTIELEKDELGNYVYNSKNISNNAIMPLLLNLWCKNEGSHTAYETELFLVSSDISVVLPLKKEKIFAGQIVPLQLQINIPSGDNVQHNISLRLEYDSI